jgi:hypothetical protein
MHNRWYYRNANGDFDPHALKIAWKNRDANKNEYHNLKKVTDLGCIYDNYTLDVAHTISTDVSWLKASKEETKLALRQPLAMVPRDEIAHDLRVGNYTLAPKQDTYLAPIKKHSIRLAS